MFFARTYEAAVPHTLWPLELFNGQTSWWSVLTKRHRRYSHINICEARPVNLWIRLLSGMVEVRGAEVMNLTDNEVTSAGFQHGRSPSPQYSHVLRQRAAVEAVTGLLIRPSWTSTLYQPSDEGTRLDDDAFDERDSVFKLKVHVRLLAWIGMPRDEITAVGDPDRACTDVPFDGSKGRRTNLRVEAGRAYMMNLVPGGCLESIVWCEDAVLRICAEVDDFQTFVLEINRVMFAMKPRVRI